MASFSDASGMKFSQSERFLKVHTRVLAEDTLLLQTFSGTETVSEPFEFRLSLVSEQADLELKDLMGEPVTVSLVAASKEDRFFHGHITSFSFVESDGGLACYKAVLEPWTAFLKHRYNCRVYQEMSVLDIVRKVLGSPEYRAFAKFEIDAKESDYRPITLCNQYNESDFDFLSRLMEEYGLFYYFTFEEGSHTLMIKDDSRNSPAMPMLEQIEYNKETGPVSEDAIYAWSPLRRIVSNKFAAKTFDFKKPTDPMNAEVETNHRMGDLPTMEHYEFPGVYAYKDDREGSQLVKRRIEVLELQSKLFNGRGNVRSMTCGHAFELTNHFDVGSTVHDRTFFVLQVTHQANNNLESESGDLHYENLFTCVRKQIPFRPQLRTPKPVMRGIQSARVVGPEGEEIHCDKYGRILLQFHWDREGEFNAQSLCWVRVATQWAGNNFGVVSLPRIGTEVLVDFIEGDPDRPIVTGAVYNEFNMPPWELPGNKTQSGILTRSTKGGSYDNANALRFEDRKGEEEVWLHAEKNQRIEVENDESHEVGHDRRKLIHHDETTEVKHDRTEKVGNNEDITIVVNRTEQVGGNETVTIRGHQNLTVMEFKNENVLLSDTLQVGAAMTTSVGGAYALTIGGAMNTAVGLAHSLEVGHSQTILVGQNLHLRVGKKIDITGGDSLSISVGSSSLTMKKDGTIILKGKEIKIESSSDTKIKAGGNVVLKGTKIKEN